VAALGQEVDRERLIGLVGSILFDASPRHWHIAVRRAQEVYA
jgi:hypothetical protein